MGDAARIHVDGIDSLMNKTFKVLDDGFVRVVDYMGGDQSIVRAARISYGKGTRKVSEDAGLIRYLMRHRHSTPLEMAEIALHVRLPMDCWRQWIRHRSAKFSNINEYSTRYSEAIDSMQKTRPDAWRKQSGTNKQGSAECFPAQADNDDASGAQFTKAEDALQQQARDVYEDRLRCGVAREQARKDLPLSTYTEVIFKIDLHNLLHFLGLRMDSHAQQEIREYATIIGEQIVAEWVPLTWAAFKDYRLNAMSLSARDIAVIQSIQHNSVDDTSQLFGWFERSKKTGKLKRNRERDECAVKLRRLGLSVPWEVGHDS